MSPLGTPAQIARESTAMGAASSLPVSLMKLVLKAGFLAAAQQQFALVGGPDAANLAALDNAVDEYALASAFSEQILRAARGEASDHDAHNRFYDEYLAVMDMTAEFYLSTVERIFKNREIATNQFVVAGRRVDLGAITKVAVMTVEGANDDISAPGQCVAALNLLTGLPESKKAQHLEPGAGHYGIFAGKSWRLNIRPLVLNFIDANSGSESGSTRKAKVKLVSA